MLSGAPRENVKLIKQDGTLIEISEVFFGKGTALIEDVTIQIEEGDYIIRSLPNGLQENYMVTDNGYFGGSGGIPAHYQPKLIKTKETPTNIRQTIVNVKKGGIVTMREKLIKLINEIPKIELKFRHFDPPKGMIVPSGDYIYDNHEFVQWLEEVKFLLQDIYDRTHDQYVWGLINATGIIHKFDGKHYDEREHFQKLKSSLNVIAQNIDKYYNDNNKGDLTMKKPMLFISHASKDLKYVQPLVELFADIGLNNETMFCSSVPGYHIPLDNDIYDYLKGLFENYDLHVVFALSKNYYKSPAALNEMGASWVLKNRYSTIVLPGFDFSKIKGAVNPSQISLKLDNKNVDELKARLGELKDIFAEEFNLSVPSIRWEKKRDTFISTINELIAEGD